MPLSEHEQRLLDQIERALYAEDPKFATTVRATDLRSHYRRRMVRSGLAFVAGVVLLFAGVIYKVALLGVVGFVVMLAALLLGLSSRQRIAGNRDARAPRSRTVPTAPSTKPTVMNRLEERWRRRWEERGR